VAFRDIPHQQKGIGLLQGALERERLAHGYLFTGHYLDDLELLARTLAKTLNCQNPTRKNGIAVDCCDECLSCRKIEHGSHGDIHWIRPESKSRVITIDQIREVAKDIQLKPTEAEYKVAVIVGADRLRVEAANAFLKTLEEPPAKSILILLTMDAEQLIETILSRCLRLNFAGDGSVKVTPEQLAWLSRFSAIASLPQKSLIGRYRLMDVLLAKLAEVRGVIDQSLTARSPIQRFPDAEKAMVGKWEDELAAAIEAEYRRQRADLLGVLHWWLRDVWLQSMSAANASGTQQAGGSLLTFPSETGSRAVADRLNSRQALANLEVIEQLQRWLGTNVQEALAIEVSLLKLEL